MTTTETVRTAAETLQEFFTRFGSGDRVGVLDLFAPDVDFRVAGAGAVPWSGPRSTTDELAAFFAATLDLVRTEAFSVDSVTVEGEHAIAQGSFRHVVLATERAFESEYALALQVREGRIVRYRMYEDSHRAAWAFDVL